MFWSFLLESFWKNPQFQLVLREQDQEDEEDSEEEDDDDEEDKMDEGSETMSTEEKKKVAKQKKKTKQCTVLVELLQKNGRQNDQINFMYIAFHIYKVISLLSD